MARLATSVGTVGRGKDTQPKMGQDREPEYAKRAAVVIFLRALFWLNGHERAKRHARREGIAFSELANGFASCSNPAALRAIWDRFGLADVPGFFDRWAAVVPAPFTNEPGPSASRPNAPWPWPARSASWSTP